MKLRGNMSYRKFREAMLKCGQVFIADLLYEEATGALVEENDIISLPALKLSLNQEEVKQLVYSLDAKIRCRSLRSEWRKDSQARIDLLQQRAEEYRTERDIQSHAAEADQKVKHLSAELNVKNDIIRSLSLDINILNQEILNFTKKHQVKSTFLANYSTHGNENSNMQPKSGRFRFFDAALSVINNKLSSILGDPGTSTDDDNNGLSHIEVKTSKVHEMLRDMETKLSVMEKDRSDALTLLFPEKKIHGCSLVQGVQKFLVQEQRYRYSLLKDIDRLSRTLRDINSKNLLSGLHALCQSAVTGKPSMEIVDYRFLSNHIALLETDAEHLQKRLGWKDAEIKNLTTEVMALRKHYNSPNEQTHTPCYEIPLTLRVDITGCVTLSTMKAILILILYVSVTNGAPSSAPHTLSADGLSTTESSIEYDKSTNPPVVTNISRIIMSMVDKGPSKSNDDVMGLPNDLVFDALIGNINTLQDQIELCEEELIEKAGNRQKHHGGSTSEADDEVKDDDVDDEEKKDKSEKSRTRLKRRALTSDTNKQSNNVAYDTFTREIVNRLSARLEYLKHSLAQCYGLFKVWNNQLAVHV
ncbi:hypothetical protein Btru_019537 [Bulinus truncatus]|nr:hypothetical protein Btru_019537 [Bulinus truncatus]